MRTALNLLHENGYKIVIFSNQGMVKSAVDGKKAEQIRKRVEIFAGEVRAFGCRFLVFASFFASVFCSFLTPFIALTFDRGRFFSYL